VTLRDVRLADGRLQYGEEPDERGITQ